MGWKGIAIGAWVGSCFGGSLGAILGAALGHQVEKKIGGSNSLGTPSSQNPYGEDGPSAKARSMVFCASAAAMLAKLAKADGRVTSDEIKSVERAFERLNFQSSARAYAVDVFRRAKDDNHSIYEYASEFASAIDSVDVRELFYGLLWDLAFSDGAAGEVELSILRQITGSLKVRFDWFGYYYRSHVGGGERSGCGGAARAEDTLLAAYRILNVPPSATDEEVKNAYRDLAKKNHPDLLRAQGLPEEMVGQATERMKRINDAWQTIRDARK